MEYVYAAMLLHKAGKEISEDSVSNILKAAGIAADTVRVKAIVASLSEVDIEEAIKSGTRPTLSNKGSRIRERILPILYQKCTEKDPKDRPSSKEILSKFLSTFSVCWVII